MLLVSLCLISAVGVHVAEDDKRIIVETFKMSLLQPFALWLSRIILNNTGSEIMCLYRKVEKLAKKKVTILSHRSFNETCVNNSL